MLINFRMSTKTNSELNRLQSQLAMIQEQQRLQKLMIKQFQEQLNSYQQKQQGNDEANLIFIYIIQIFFLSSITITIGRGGRRWRGEFTIRFNVEIR